MDFFKKLRHLLLPMMLSFSAFANSGQVNIITASAEELAAALNGIGQNKAAAIVEYRQTHGPFKDLSELAKVKGIGAKTVMINKDRMTVETPESK